MIVGGAILNALSHHPLSASAFCLSSYYRLTPVEESISHRCTPHAGRWARIEIFHSNDGAPHNQKMQDSDGPAKQPNSSKSHIADGHADCHFVVCSGHGGNDGQIQSTENWHSQLPANRLPPDHTESAGDNEGTIYICIATDSKSTAPSDFQIRRTEALVEELCRRFDIRPEAVLYPNCNS
jgi:hypothetical protein